MIYSLSPQRSASGDRTPAALLARASAALALSQLIRPLISLNADLVYTILALLSLHLPGVELKEKQEEEAKGNESASEVNM